MDAFMGIVNSAWVFLFNNVLSRPAIFIGLIVLVGYILLKQWLVI